MKTICIYHSRDLDGWMSAAIVKRWFKENNNQNSPQVRIYDSPYVDHTTVRKPENEISLTFLGWDYSDEIPNLSEYDKVIMCDVSFPAEEMKKLKDKHMGIFNPTFIYIDHHISAMKNLGIDNENSFAPKYDGIQNTNYAACELTWKYFFPKEEMPEIVRLLGRYDCFGHKQVWKPVIGYEGLYEVSNHGNVRSLNRVIVENNTNKVRSIKGVNLSIANSKRGYRVVVLCKDGTEKIRNVHQLVAESFIPNLENKPCINHKDFNRLNNRVENLEWCTYAENNLHSIEEGRRGKTVIQLTKDGEFVQQFDSIKRAESYTGIASQNIGKVCKGERIFAGNYRWEYGVDKDIFPQFVPQDEEQKVLEFQYGARQAISNYKEAYNYLEANYKLDNEIDECEVDYHMAVEGIHDNGKAIYRYLCAEAKQIYKRAFPIEFGERHNAKLFLCVNQPRFNPINFGIDYHKEGYDGFTCFHYEKGKWCFSLYNDNGLVDCSQIAKQFGGGGHKGASGFIIDDLSKIIK